CPIESPPTPPSPRCWRTCAARGGWTGIGSVVCGSTVPCVIAPPMRPNVCTVPWTTVVILTRLCCVSVTAWTRRTSISFGNCWPTSPETSLHELVRFSTGDGAAVECCDPLGSACLPPWPVPLGPGHDRTVDARQHRLAAQLCRFAGHSGHPDDGVRREGVHRCLYRSGPGGAHQRGGKRAGCSRAPGHCGTDPSCVDGRSQVQAPYRMGP